MTYKMCNKKSSHLSCVVCHESCVIKSAFGLLESIIALAIMSLLSIAIGSFIVLSYRTSRFAEEQREAISSARRGIDTMVQEEQIVTDNELDDIEKDLTNLEDINEQDNNNYEFEI